MLRSMRSRMLSSIIILMLLFSGITTILVWENTHRVISDTRENDALNLIASIRTLVETQYNSIKFHRQFMMDERKKELRMIVDVSFATITSYYQQSQQGIISEAEAKRRAMQVISDIRYDHGNGYLWINDTGKPIPRMLMHPMLPEYNGKILDDPIFNCALGRDENVLVAFRDVSTSDGEGYVDYLWPKPGGNMDKREPKLSFVRLFRPWNWVVGTGLYIDDIDQEEHRRLQAVIDETQKAFENLRIGKSGYVFILDNKGMLLVHPYMPSKAADDINPSTGNMLYQDMIDSMHNGLGRLDYLWNKPPQDSEHYIYPKRTYLTYFEPLQWYIGSSLFVDEIEESATHLRNTILLISSISLLLAFLVVILLTGQINSPLKQLVKDANQIRLRGISNHRVVITGPEETRELGMVLNRMLDSLQLSETALIESEEDLRITLNSIGDAVITTNNTNRITRMNPVAERLTGWQFEDARGKLVEEVLQFSDSDSRARIETPTYKVLETMNTLSMDKPVILTNKQNHERIISDSAAPIMNLEGKVSGAVIIFRDVTQQVEAEKQLRQRQKMDSIGQLAGGIAHDFNNMLAGILGFAELLGMKQNIDKETKTYVEGICKSAITASELVNKLLSFARENALIHKNFDIHDSINDAIILLKRSLNKAIVLEIAPKAEHSILHGDAAQIENVILNLGINARDAMPDGGKLLIETDNVYLDETFCNASSFELKEGEYLLLKITDSGCGIPTNRIDKIFEPYFTTKEIGKGTGLGLAAVYGTVTSHHGAIYVYSEVDKGTVFHLYFPLVEGTIKKTEKPEIKLIHGTGGVLVVDDEQLIRMMAKDILTKLGYTVYLASDGIEGLEIYRANKDDISLVILDMVMPRMTGENCFRELVSINPDIKVIISTGFAMTEATERLQREGAAGFIKKPYSLVDISKLLAKVLNIEPEEPSV